MNDEVELQPLVTGAISVMSKEKLNFPTNEMIQAHITDGRFGKFQKEVEDKETGEKKTILQNKVVYTFEVDSDVIDPVSKEKLQGKTFNKTIALSDHERATYPKFIQAVIGAYSAEPAVVLGKPLQVMFGEETEFGGTKYQPITYLPPAKGQKAPTKDVVLSPEEAEKQISEMFGPEVKK